MYIKRTIVAGNGERCHVPCTGFIDPDRDSGTRGETVRFAHGNVTRDSRKREAWLTDILKIYQAFVVSALRRWLGRRWKSAIPVAHIAALNRHHAGSEATAAAAAACSLSRSWTWCLGVRLPTPFVIVEYLAYYSFLASILFGGGVSTFVP